jgi:hypothetical protein
MHILDIRITLPFLCLKRARSTGIDTQGTVFSYILISDLYPVSTANSPLDKSEVLRGMRFG